MSFSVYWIRKATHSDIMTQGYVGVSGNVKQRFAAHKNMERGTNQHMRRAITKYGWDNLVKSVLLIADKDYCLDIERKLRPADKIGWNLTIGGGYPPVLSGPQPQLRGRPAWNKGKTGIFSPETLERMRQKQLGVSPGNKGMPLTDEQKQKLSKALKGRVSPRKGVKLPAELVERVSAKNRGRVQSAEERAMRSDRLKGIKKSVPMSDEHRAKLGLLAKGKRWYNNGQNVVFCLEGMQPEGYTLGRNSRKLCKEK
jgi:predicted GIY-YIG superfamily endonuclease